MSTALMIHTETDAPSDDKALLVLEQIKSKLASITSVEEAKETADKADWVLHYVKRARLGLAAQNHCAYVRLLAERRAGELIEQMEKHTGRPAKASHVERLSDLGITYNNSYRWRALARFSLADLERLWKEYDKYHDELTTAAVMRKLRTQLDPDDYRKLMTPYHANHNTDELSKAANRLLTEVLWFTNRLGKRGRLYSDMGVVLALSDDDDIEMASWSRPVDKILGAFLECRQRIDQCIGALERSCDRMPVAWGNEGRSLLDYLSEEPEIAVAGSPR
jgi:hypothetical protein